MTIRRLSPADVRAYRRVRLFALREFPVAFGSAYADEAKMPVAQFRERLRLSPDKWTFGAFDRQRLVGIVTLMREGGAKQKHKAGIYAMYVAPRARGRGLGRKLLQLALDKAAQLPGLRQVRLSVTEKNPAAVALYKSLGFEVYGREADALFIRGKYYAELLLARRVVRGPTER